MFILTTRTSTVYSPWRIPPAAGDVDGVEIPKKMTKKHHTYLKTRRYICS